MINGELINKDIRCVPAIELYACEEIVSARRKGRKIVSKRLRSGPFGTISGWDAISGRNTDFELISVSIGFILTVDIISIS